MIVTVYKEMAVKTMTEVTNIFSLQTLMPRKDGIRTDGMSEGKSPDGDD